MAYDIFISYRRDGGKELARPLKSELERRGYRVFLDFDELKDGVFDRRIMEAIDSSPIFMVVLSPHALDRCVNDDDWVRREIEYAMKHDRHIVPVNPDLAFDGFPDGLPEALKSGLGQHQFSEVMFGQLFMASVDKMVSDRIEPLLSRLGRAADAERQKQAGALFHVEADMECRMLKFGREIAVARPGEDVTIRLPKGRHKLEFVSTECPDDRLSILHTVEDNEMVDILSVELRPVREKRLQEERERRVFVVGDYYNENGKEGVVFEVDATGRHGKIVGMKQTKLAWAENLNFGDWWFRRDIPCKKKTGACDQYDGMKNMQTIRRIDGWREKYPAFVWCVDQGDGWYLPAIKELEKFTRNDSIHDAVNRTLSQHGGAALFNKGDNWIGYWSSSERNRKLAWYVLMNGCYTGDTYKYASDYVRAVSAF